MDKAHKMSPSQLEHAYHTMCLIREFEQLSLRLHNQGLMRGSIHLCNGQEAIAAGACLALREGDYLTTTYRGHGHILARGGDPGRMLAEMMGRSGGCAAATAEPCTLPTLVGEFSARTASSAAAYRWLSARP